MARAERGQNSKNTRPTGELPASPDAAQLPLVRVPRGKKRANLQVCVVCEAPQRWESLLAFLNAACDRAGLLAPVAIEPADASAEAETIARSTASTITLCVFDAEGEAAPTQDCVLLCEELSDQVLRSAFACCALGIVTKHDLIHNELTTKLTDARALLEQRTSKAFSPAQLTAKGSASKNLSAKSLTTKNTSQNSTDMSRRTKREERLLKAARSIAASRDALATQLAMVCEQLSQSCMDVSNQLSHVALASELQTLLRQELDIESVLRTSLEFMLRKLGPANAAIYLPSTTGDYTLGAYINYDCPRDGIEHTLDHLGDAIVPDYSDRPGLHVIEACERDIPTITSAWVQDSTMIVYSAHNENECTAVIAVFRDQHTGFTSEQRKLVSTIGGMLGEQLARIVKTHHRWKAA
jgi:hypothetical protein